MTTYSRDRADGVPTRFIDVSEHPRIKQIALGIDVQDGQTAITVHGYTAGGETVVLEHAVVENGSTIVHRSLGGHEIAGRLLIADEAGSADWRAVKDGGSKVELIRTRQEARDRAAQAKLAMDRYEIDVREGRRQADGGERLRLRLAHTEAHHALLTADHARSVRAIA